MTRRRCVAAVGRVGLAKDMDVLDEVADAMTWLQLPHELAVPRELQTRSGRIKITTSAVGDADSELSGHTMIRVTNMDDKDVGVILTVLPQPVDHPLQAALIRFGAPARGLVGRALSRLDPREQTRYSEEWAADATDISGTGTSCVGLSVSG
jgi:hypothetical protein